VVNDSPPRYYVLASTRGEAAFEVRVETNHYSLPGPADSHLIRTDAGILAAGTRRLTSRRLVAKPDLISKPVLMSI